MAPVGRGTRAIEICRPNRAKRANRLAATADLDASLQRGRLRAVNQQSHQETLALSTANATSQTDAPAVAKTYQELLDFRGLLFFQAHRGRFDRLFLWLLIRRRGRLFFGLLGQCVFYFTLNLPGNLRHQLLFHLGN